jgi:DNA polymerase III epsilon subunit-like protein
MKILVFDTETTGLDTSKDYILELAWATYNVSSFGWNLINVKSEILSWIPHPVTITPEIQSLTGISEDLIHKHGRHPGAVIEQLWIDSMCCDFVAGMNIIKFDTPMVNRAMPLLEQSRQYMWDKNLFKKNHIDLWFDVEFPPHLKRKALKYMALDHDYVLMNAHRAVSDVLATGHILSRYPIDKILERSLTPLVKATIVPNWGDKVLRQAVYENGFHWNRDRKVYEKEMRAFDLAKLPFEVKVESTLTIGEKQGEQTSFATDPIPAIEPTAEQISLFQDQDSLFSDS